MLELHSGVVVTLRCLCIGAHTKVGQLPLHIRANVLAANITAQII